jgi:hypothetical protein
MVTAVAVCCPNRIFALASKGVSIRITGPEAADGLEVQGRMTLICPSQVQRAQR